MSIHDMAVCAWPGKNRDSQTSYFTVCLVTLDVRELQNCYN